jgi:GNAT superfamily N-acetyltransferase
MDLVIRPYASDDWEGVCRVHDAARPIEVAEYMPPDTVPVMRDAAIVDGEFYESNVYVACHGTGEVVGFIAVHGEELTWMFVAPHVHRRGVGRRLVEHVRDELGPHGYVLCALENRGGFAFYQAVGFRPVAFFPGETRGFPCTCVRMTFPGSRHADRPPRPAPSSLRAHGFPEDDPGRGVRGEDGVWRWER